jgi:PAS domain S-box-containing protein
VLLVDDQVRNLEALQAVLATSGCTLLCAQSANEALLYLLEHEFAAIVLDIRMPGMSGLELAQLIKSRKRSRHIPILFITAHLLEEKDILRGYEVGAVDYLTKPLNPEILRSKIAVFVDLYRKSRALSVANDALQREIAERERAQAALRVANQELESRVEARTAEVLQAHAVLQASEERLRLALDAGRMGTWELDEVTQIGQLDDTQCVLLGIPPDSGTLPARAFYDLVHSDDRELLRERVNRARVESISGVGIFEVDFRVVRPLDGSVRWLHCSGRSLAGAPGRPPRTVGVTFDITGRKESEQALTEADRRKNDFLATLAHELRNPLAPIRNAVEVLILKGPAHPELQWARQLIARQVQQLTRLVDDLLDISRITRDKLELRREAVDLASIVEAAVETSRPLVDGGRHTLTVKLPPEPLMLDADATRLSQVVANLLNNAARYSDDEGQIELTVERDGCDAVIHVVDKGHGIAPEMLPRVFDMFVQGGSSEHRSGSGLGVGLALAKRLVEMHEGNITARSNGLGQGCEFVIRLPTLSTAASLSLSQAGSDVSNLTSSLRVLLVDDNVDAVQSLSVLLELMGNQIRSAYDGVEALEAASNFQPDVVLLDIGLPKLSGYEVARRIRLQSVGRPVRLIALTGFGQDVDRRLSREAGFDNHFVKPVDPKALLKLLSDISASRPAAAPLA